MPSSSCAVRRPWHLGQRVFSALSTVWGGVVAGGLVCVGIGSTWVHACTLGTILLDSQITVCERGDRGENFLSVWRLLAMPCQCGVSSRLWAFNRILQSPVVLGFVWMFWLCVVGSVGRSPLCWLCKASIMSVQWLSCRAQGT